MFKATLLGQWHSLPDAALEQALSVRIDFLQFCGLSLSYDIPDETTLCWFRNRLVANDRLDGLLAAINEQLQSHGLMVKGATGAVIDATLIESAARPKKTITLEVDAEGKAVQFEDGSQPGISCFDAQSADADAIWLKKGKKSQFGYRGYLVVDAQDGYDVRGVHTAPANQSEMMHFEAAIDGAHIEANRVYADKGSGSQRQSAASKKAKNQERNHESRIQE
ncbi:transposase, IS5 family [Nitrosomonas sp. Nm166]|nr:transposase, IS5 family [Nitrosomonas sp. Nm166]